MTPPAPPTRTTRSARANAPLPSPDQRDPRVLRRGMILRALTATTVAAIVLGGTAIAGSGAGEAVAAPLLLAADAAPAAGDVPTPVDSRQVVSPFLEKSGTIILSLLAFAQMLAVIRLLQGPSLADRVVAIDFIGVACAGMVGVYSVITEEPLYLRVAIVLSLVSFLGTIGFALYLEKRGLR